MQILLQTLFNAPVKLSLFHSFDRRASKAGDMLQMQQSTTTLLQSGQLANQWKSIRLLGYGGFGAVYLVADMDGQEFVLKTENVAVSRPSAQDGY